MPYKTKSDLPESVKHVLPSHAQDIYKEAFNSAWDQYKDKILPGFKSMIWSTAFSGCWITSCAGHLIWFHQIRHLSLYHKFLLILKEKLVQLKQEVSFSLTFTFVLNNFLF